MIKKLPILTFTVLLTFAACKKWEATYPDEIKNNCVTGISTVKKVLLIGVDGCRADALVEAASPAFDSLMAHAYVNLHTERGEHTLSAPGWSTILHGVYPDKHGVFSNNISQLDYGSYYDFFYYMRQHNASFSLSVVAHWSNFLRLISSEDYAQTPDSDEAVKEEALHLLAHCTPDVLVLHFDDVDHAGHFSGGFSPKNKKYIDAIQQTGLYVDEIMQAIKDREQQFGEEWMVVVATDHGGKGIGHGGQNEVENTRYVFSIFRLPNMTRNDLPTVSNVDIMPTILKYMNVPIDSAWDLDGQALF